MVNRSEVREGMYQQPAAAFDEQHRLEVPRTPAVLDSAPDAVFDGLAALAARLLDRPDLALG